MLCHAPGSHRRQRGVVLIMALLIVALVTTVVVQISWRFNLSMARNENRWHGAQARAYMEGGEQLARKILMEDAKESQIDFLGEMWAQQGQPLPTDEGWVRGELEDAHGRFNLNSLVPPPPKPPTGDNKENPIPAPEDQYSAAQRRFIRFLQTIELESGPLDQTAAFDIVAAISDWIDGDSRVTQGPFGGTGAEASEYDSLDPPVVIPNSEMTSVSELSLIKGMTPELYKKLEPYVIALPAKGFEMNINTVRPEILRAFNLKGEFFPLDEGSWGAVVEARNAALEGIASVDQFVSAVSAVLGIDAAQFDTEGLGVASYYFIYKGETLVGEQVRRGKSLLFRENANVVDVVRRTDGNF